MLVLGVKLLAQPRHPEGPIQNRSQAENTGELWNYSGRQEDVEELSNIDKQKIVEFVQESTDIMAKARLPACSWWEGLTGKRGKTCN